MVCFWGISTILKNLKRANPTTLVAVVFLFGTILITLGFAFQSESQAVFSAQASVFGGPLQETSENSNDLGFLEAVSEIDTVHADVFTMEDEEYGAFDGAALVHHANPLDSRFARRDGIILHKVQKGETLSNIGASYGVSLNTLLWANPTLRKNVIRPGDEITILPVSGILHEIAAGESVESIAIFYSIAPQEIVKANPRLATETIMEGEKLIIPGGRLQERSSLTAHLPDLKGYFTLPASGWNWGQLHANNAVDIANACGTAIYAAAEGLVVKTGSPNNWNGGYGGYVDIEHPNGTRTRYAHTESNIASIGDYIEKGQLIAEVGNTGNTNGPTSCHLHFEVHGAKNPFAK
ncbi:MAG: M23 family metallopeptidase [Patescibacteria group bacterium]